MPDNNNKTLKKESCIDLCKFILEKNPEYKKELTDYINSFNANKKNTNIYTNKSLCEIALNFTKD